MNLGKVFRSSEINIGYPHEEEVILSVAQTIQNYEEKRSTLNADIDNLLAQLATLYEKAHKGEL